MISSVLFVNQKGEVIISRHYRDGYSKQIAETFRTQVLGSKEVRGGTHSTLPSSPGRRRAAALCAPLCAHAVRTPSDPHPPAVAASFFRPSIVVLCAYVCATCAQAGRRREDHRQHDLPLRDGGQHVRGRCRGERAGGAAFQFLHELVKVLKSYFGDFSRSRPTTLSSSSFGRGARYGYPQNCSTDVLKMYITQQGDKSAADLKAQAQAVTIQATGAISCARRGSSTGRTSSSSTSSRTATCSCRTRGRSCATT